MAGQQNDGGRRRRTWETQGNFMDIIAIEADTYRNLPTARSKDEDGEP